MEAQAVERDNAAQRNAIAKLLRAYHEHGDTAARERLVEMHLPLVDSLVRRHASIAEDYEDLFQVGYIGLINAIDRFDPERGQDLPAFAVPTITGEIRRHLRDRAASVRLPRRVLELRSPTAVAQAELAASLGRAPTLGEVAQRVGAPEEDVALALDATRASQGVELEAQADAATAAGDGADDRLFLAEAFRGLNERERRLIFLRYVRDMTPGETARELGISERQVSRATQAALIKLRAGLDGDAEGEAVPVPAPEKRLPGPRREPKMAEMATTPAVVTETATEESYHVELVRRAGPE